MQTSIMTIIGGVPKVKNRQIYISLYNFFSMTATASHYNQKHLFFFDQTKASIPFTKAPSKEVTKGPHLTKR